MVWKLTVYHNARIHVVAPVSVIETGLPSYHHPVKQFEGDFIGIENFAREMLLTDQSRIISEKESKEAYQQIFKYLRVRSWKKITENYLNYSIIPKGDGIYAISRAKFYNEKDNRGFGRDERFPQVEFDLKMTGSLSRHLASLFAN